MAVNAVESIRAAGRPRNAAAGSAILAAARRLVIEHGYEAVTTRMIADAAGTGKQTLYRRWPSKAELILDAFAAYAEAEVDLPTQADEPVRERLAAFLARTFAALVETGPAIRGLMATAQHDPGFRTVFRTRFIEPRRRALATLLRLGVSAGQLDPEADVEAAVIAVYGALWYRLLLDEPLDAPTAARLAAVTIDGMRRAQ